MRHASLRIFGLLFLLGCLMTARAGVSAAPPEPKPATLPCAVNVSVQLLGAGKPATAEDQALVLGRVIFGVGGSLGPHTHPGTLVASVESGTLGFTLVDDGEMPITRSGDAGTPVAEEMISTGQEVELHPGDGFVEMGMVHSARAIGDEPAVVILSGLIEAGQPLTACAE
jgi:quercetin dioxygenase-like cupin family protein